MRRPGPQRKTSGGRWQKTRERILRRDKYLCQECLRREDRPTPATQVDHIKPIAKGGSDADDNLESLCKPCHDAKTRRDMGHKVSGACDENGFPVSPDHAWNK